MNNAIFSLAHLYVLAGLVLAFVAVTTAPNATKMSSPKNRPTLSADAAIARSRQRTLSGSDPWRASAAPSAIGAISGRTICTWPPSAVRPTAARPSRTAR